MGCNPINNDHYFRKIRGERGDTKNNYPITLKTQKPKKMVVSITKWLGVVMICVFSIE